MEKEANRKREVEVGSSGSSSSFTGDLKEVIGIEGGENLVVEVIAVPKNLNFLFKVEPLDELILAEILHSANVKSGEGWISLGEIWRTSANKLNRLASYLGSDGAMTWETFAKKAERFLSAYSQAEGGIDLVEVN